MVALKGEDVVDQPPAQEADPLGAGTEKGWALRWLQPCGQRVHSGWWSGVSLVQLLSGPRNRQLDVYLGCGWRRVRDGAGWHGFPPGWNVA